MRKRLRKKVVKLILSRTVFGDVTRDDGLFMVPYSREWLDRFSVGQLRAAVRLLRVKRCRLRCCNKDNTIDLF